MIAKGSKISHYTPEFRDEAVRYRAWKDSGKTVPECASDLGIKLSTFSRWVTVSNRAAKTSGSPSSFSESARMGQFQKENEFL